jgi:hypothetical protein
MESRQGLVSLVIPVYNGAAYVAQAVQSMLNQTYRDVEVIAVDDGSTDESAAVLADFGDQIRLVRQRNGGVASARNAGIRAAQGEFIGFLDQDDWSLPERVECQVARFRASESVGLVHTDIHLFESGRGTFAPPPLPQGPWDAELMSRPDQMVGDCFDQLLLSNPICNSSVMVRRNVLDQVGGVDSRILGNTVQDYDLWLRLARLCQFDHIATPLTIFRLHGGQGHRDRRAMLEEELKVLLRTMPEKEWRRSRRGRLRLAAICDQLAVAHLDAGDLRSARQRFRGALRFDRSPRTVLRFAASCLPIGLVQRLRDTVGRLRKGVGAQSTLMVESAEPSS